MDPNTAQTPGMNRATAINNARAGAEKIWAGTVTIHANAKTGRITTVTSKAYFVAKGKARMRWGNDLSLRRGGTWHFIYVPPYVPHQEINDKQRRDA